MNFFGILFQIEEAAKNIRRNGLMSVAALSTVTMAMVVLGGALLTIYRLNQFAETQPRQFEIEVFLKPELNRANAEKVQDRISTIPGVEYVHLFTREQAWKEMEGKDSDTSSAVSEALSDTNPLPDRLDVKLLDPKDTSSLTKRLQDSSKFPEVHKIQDAHDELDKLIAFSHMVRNIGIIASLGLLFATAMVIQNTIKLTVAARRKEIRIMQLVGATQGFIKLPLALEGAFYGFTGAVFAAGIVAIIAVQVTQYTAKLASPLTKTMPPIAHPMLLTFWLCCIGVTVGLIGSYLSMRKFLRKV